MMNLAFFILLSAVILEGLGSTISIIGASAMFGNNILILCLFGMLDIAKLLIVTLLYKRWAKLNFVLRLYAVIAVVVTMVITSTGAAGYLTSAFQEAIVGVQQGTTQVELLQVERTKLENRKNEIDEQISNLPTSDVKGRVKLARQFATEQRSVTERIATLDKQITELKVQHIDTEAHAGPILTLAKAANIDTGTAVNLVVGMVILVFDPLAVFMVIIGNHLLKAREEIELEIPGDIKIINDVPIIEEKISPLESPDDTPEILPFVPVKEVMQFPIIEEQKIEERISDIPIIVENKEITPVDNTRPNTPQDEEPAVEHMPELTLELLPPDEVEELSEPIREVDIYTDLDADIQALEEEMAADAEILQDIIATSSRNEVITKEMLAGYQAQIFWTDVPPAQMLSYYSH